MSRPNVRLLQIVPYLPGTREGVGDYALNVARALRRDHGVDTLFAVARSHATDSIDAFQVAPSVQANVHERVDHALLHFVNYGYHHRGVPVFLSRRARELRAHIRGRWITNFHELYASGPPWRSAFWLRGLQKKIARTLIDISDTCFVSNEPIATEIRRYASAKGITLCPIGSNFGEPVISRFDDRSSHRWIICGGTALITRSARSLATLMGKLPAWCAPQHLDVVGGTDVPELQSALEQLRSRRSEMQVERHPDVTVADASALLQQAGFGWFDYFGSGKVWPGMIFKSGSFAACCAHGVVPIVAHVEEQLGLHGDSLAGPFYLTHRATRLPDEQTLPATREQIYRWYHRHASLSVAASRYAEALR